jgi:hypothetical protein
LLQCSSIQCLPCSSWLRSSTSQALKGADTGHRRGRRIFARQPEPPAHRIHAPSTRGRTALL